MLCIITFFHKSRKNLRQEYYVQSHPRHTKGLINYIDNLRTHLDTHYRRGDVHVEFIRFMPKIFNTKQIGEITSYFYHITGECNRSHYTYTINDKTPYYVIRKA